MYKKLTKRSANYRALRVITKSERIADAMLPPNTAFNRTAWNGAAQDRKPQAAAG